MNLVAQLDSLHKWLDRTQLADDDAIAPYVEAMEQVLAQDTEQDEHGRIQIIRGVAADRRVFRTSLPDGAGRGSAGQQCRRTKRRKADAPSLSDHEIANVDICFSWYAGA
jgi:hypothetical protein